MAIQTASGLGLADGHSGDVATEEPVEKKPRADYVGSPVVMDQRGSISAIKRVQANWKNRYCSPRSG